MNTDRIEKNIVLKAPRSRVWQAVATVEEFNAWFGVNLKGRLEPGAKVAGKITIPGYDHLTMELTVDKVEPEHYLSFRWHPHAIDPKVDYSSEPTTLVELKLEEVAGGTKLTIVESGFEGIPIARRAEAVRSNSGGWEQQLQNIARHVAT